MILEFLSGLFVTLIGIKFYIGKFSNAGLKTLAEKYRRALSDLRYNY